MRGLTLALALLASASAERCPWATEISDEHRATYPKLTSMIDLACSDADALVEEIVKSPIAAIAKSVDVAASSGVARRRAQATADASTSTPLPIVVAHGMGDSCFNSGMESITQLAGDQVGVYSVCIPTGDTRIKDTINGFLLDMDSSVDVFAAAIKADPNLAGGFNAFGLSQGNNLIRGYIAKYNDPPVSTFMSICGINAGVGAFPDCSPQGKHIGGVCETIAETLGALAYNDFVQGHLFQANYYRDPSKTDTDAYKTHSQLAQWENEGNAINATLNENFAKTDKFVLVKGNEDMVVWPRDGEWFGAMDPSDPWGTVQPYNETAWYTGDTFGLRTADEAGKLSFESFTGGHIDFSQAELEAWLDEYFM